MAANRRKFFGNFCTIGNCRLKMASSILLICFFLCITWTNALYRTYDTTRYDIFGDFITQEFGMAVGGTIQIDYNVQPTYASKKFDSYVILLVLTRDQANGWYSDLKNDANSDSIMSMCSQPSMFRQELFGSGTLSYNIDYALGENRYSVAVLQCRSGYESNPVTVSVDLTMKNPRPNSDEMSHFSIEHVMEIRVIEGELIIYALMILGMLGQIILAR